MNTEIQEVRLNTYPAYKDSGVEWLGEIPEHWELSRLASIGKFSSSGIDKLNNTNESKVAIINYTDVYRNKRFILDSSIDYMVVTTPEENRVRNLLNKGDLIFLPSSETFEDLGLSALVNEQMENVAFSYHVLRFQFNKELSHNFKKYFTNNPKVLNQFSGRGTGSIRKTLNRNDFRNTLVILPPLSEQTAIANFLDDKCAKIDAAVEIKQQQITLLNERRQIAIHQAITQGLDKDVPMKDSGVEWIGSIPEHWNLVSIRRLIQITDGTHDTPFYLEKSPESLPLITSKDFVNGVVDFQDCKYISRLDHDEIKKRSGVKNGDVLMSMIGGNIGKSVIVQSEKEFSVKNVAIFKTKSDFSLAKFILFYIESGLLNNQIVINSKGGAQGFLSLRDVRDLLFFKMPYSEQEAIVNHLDKITFKIDSVVSLYQQEIEKLKEYKTTLINSAVTGKIKVPGVN